MDADVVRIYERLRESYPVTLKNSLAMGYKSSMDFPVLCGKSCLGKFEVCFDDVSFPFYAMHDDGVIYAHWHLQAPSEVEKTVVDFMEGKISQLQFG